MVSCREQGLVRRDWIEVTEGLEESWDVLSHDPDPRVTHAELDSLPMRPGFNGDAAALGREHDRVREEVVKDLPNPEGVCHQGRVAFLHINRKLKALRLGVRAEVRPGRPAASRRPG